MVFRFERYKGNPILKPIPNHMWESMMVFNCAALLKGEKIHILYRARGSKGGVSRLGYASSSDGFKIDERLEKPVFSPELGNELECLGCEDPRLTEIGEKIYLSYTAYGRVPGMVPPYNSIQVAITSISTDDFLKRRWNWGKRIYPFPLVDNKHACIFPERIGGRWAMYHRIPPHIWIAYSDDLSSWKDSSIVLSPREEWEYFKLGGGAPPLKTDEGWLFIYHAVDMEWRYRL
ncbi:MAG: glycosidase, partial [Candidatus Bathyarchaeia archaeon]